MTGQPEDGAISKPLAGQRRDHGWWPYVLPYAGFLLGIEILGRILPESASGVGLVLKPAIPALLLAYFAWRGAYPELRRPRPELRRPRPELRRPQPDLRGYALDVGLGLVLAGLWMAPFLWIEALRPQGPGFDPDQLGEANRNLALALRLVGYAIVTPVFEELFIRSFVMRYSEVYAQRGDFRSVPLARYSARSFAVTVVVFTLGHVPWEWWVAVPWVALTNLWFYYRKDLYAVILTHATTNAAILLTAVACSGRLTGADGQPISLWFFV